MHRIIAILFLFSVSALAEGKARLKWEALPDLPDTIGVAGPFVGVHNDALIVAGGANFPVPGGRDLWEANKIYHDTAWVLTREEVDGKYVYEWKTGFKLKQPVAYGMCVSTDKGVVCIGGQTGELVYSEVFRLEWNPKTKTLIQTELPSLPSRCTAGAAAMVGDFVYVAGGQSEAKLETAMTNFWRMDLSKSVMEARWKKLPPLPVLGRAFNQMVAQHNGREMCLYVFGGRRQNAKVEGIAGIIAMNDIYEFSPARLKRGKEEAWRERKGSPKPIMAGTAVAVGQSHVFVVGGADGSLFCIEGQ